jgi:hypothetical protein
MIRHQRSTKRQSRALNARLFFSKIYISLDKFWSKKRNEKPRHSAGYRPSTNTMQNASIGFAVMEETETKKGKWMSFMPE